MHGNAQHVSVAWSGERGKRGGKGEVEENAPSFSTSVEMGPVFIIIGAQSSPENPAHPLSLGPCLAWLESWASAVLGVPPLTPFATTSSTRPFCTRSLWARRRGHAAAGAPRRAAPPPRAPQRPPVAARWVSSLFTRTPLAPSLPALPLSPYLTLWRWVSQDVLASAALPGLRLCGPLSLQRPRL